MTLLRATVIVVVDFVVVDFVIFVVVVVNVVVVVLFVFTDHIIFSCGQEMLKSGEEQQERKVRRSGRT